MNIGASAEDIGLMILLLVPGLLAPALLIGLGLLIGRALRLPAIFAPLFALAICSALLFGGSLYLDAAGQIRSGVVDQRSETFEVKRSGTWLQHREVQIRYQLDQAAPLSEVPSIGESSVSLSLSPAQFDRLTQGEPTELRILPLFRSLALVRLANTTTAEYIPWSWLGVVGGIIAFYLLARPLMRTNLGGTLVIVAVLIAAIAIPSGVVYRNWQASEDLASRPLRADAAVISVTRVTQIDPFPCGSGGRSCGRRNTLYDVAQQYDVVELRYRPDGGSNDVLAIEAVDAGNTPITTGQIVPIAYSPDQTRAPQILGASHSHYWRNPLMFLWPMLGIELIILAILWWGLRRLSQQRKARRAATI